MRDALKIYRQTQREAVPEEASLGTLMRALVDSASAARRAMAAGDWETSNKHLLACQTVLWSLRLGVNPDRSYAYSGETVLVAQSHRPE